jgi:hypothetical protein
MLFSNNNLRRGKERTLKGKSRGDSAALGNFRKYCKDQCALFLRDEQARRKYLYKLVYRQNFDRIVTTAAISHNFDSLFEFQPLINEGSSLSLF